MKKTKVILVVLNRKIFANVLRSLNYDKVSLYVVLMEGGDGKFLRFGDKVKVQMLEFEYLDQVLESGVNFFWLICGGNDASGTANRMKDFLMLNDVPERNIINFGWAEPFSEAWSKNLQLVESGAVNAFATGDGLTERGLDFTNLPDVKVANLAAPNQDLRQSLRIAQHIFKTVKRGVVKFAFIGLTPYSLRVDARKDFATCADDIKYSLALSENPKADSFHNKVLAAILSATVKNIFKPADTANASDKSADTADEDKTPATAPDKKFSVDDLADWREELERLTKPFDEETVESNLRVLEDYVKLCNEHGATPIAVVFPFADKLKDKYSRESLLFLRRELQRLERVYHLTVIDFFDATLNYACFCDMTRLNPKGARIASTAVDFRLRGRNFLSIGKIAQMNYSQVFNISNFLPKDDFNDTLEKYFRLAVKKIRGKRKISVAFVSDDPSMWCGDELYKLFADNHRCEVTFFLCLQKAMRDQPLVVEDFNRGLEEFKARGINVVGITDDEQTAPPQDVLIMLRPYFHYLPKAFTLSSITAETLTVYIPYGFNTSVWKVFDTPIHRFGWKLFFESREHVSKVAESCRDGAPRCYFSGYTKLDPFFKQDAALTFDWKMARPDAKKIIYAPHWSIASGIFYATFQWNYKFMYEFAKAHPEISWVFKPHPMLFATAVTHDVFKTEEDFKAYLQAWDDLPNAKVFTGAYYQGLFATSDGMIMDCGSWIGEYQYTHKPMIFLTRDTQRFNDLGEELMKILYRVNGKNLQEIAALMQKVFINGKDDLFEARMKFFDEHLNYRKANGMTASEFVFRTIAKDLGL